MTHTERLQRSPKAFRQLTGITPAAFDRLLADLTPRYDQAEARRKDRPGRRRRPGAGRKHALDLADRLLMLLMYYRTYATHALLGFLFGVDDSAVCRNINPLQPLLAGIFRIPERKVKLDPEDLRELFFDATERPTRRPEGGQREFYSGKKRHTIKTQVVVVRRTEPPGPGAKPRKVRIAAVAASCPGSTHDKKLYDRSRVIVPAGCEADGGHGLPRHGSGDTHSQAARGGELTARQKAGNRRVARRRIAAEHGIGKMKVWRVASECYRNPVNRHTLIMKNVAGLHNLMFA